MALNKALVQSLFPPVEFAFFGNYINRYRRKVLQKRLPSIDLILAVKNSKNFHYDNLKKNKSHYTYFARSTHGLAINFIQEYGARIHFNEFKAEGKEVLELLSKEEESTSAEPTSSQALKIRYGVIELGDMMRDLEHWETLLTSSFM